MSDDSTPDGLPADALREAITQQLEAAIARPHYGVVRINLQGTRTYDGIVWDVFEVEPVDE